MFKTNPWVYSVIMKVSGYHSSAQEDVLPMGFHPQASGKIKSYLSGPFPGRTHVLVWCWVGAGHREAITLGFLHTFSENLCSWAIVVCLKQPL